MHSVSRLIEQFIPDSYQLSIILKRVPREFSGIVTVRGTILSDGQTMRVHAKDLTIESVTLDGKTADFWQEENDELVISHPELLRGHHTVVVAFSGQITDTMHGLYPCYYALNGEKKELLATQFESHHAREVFPCIDEPEAKAIFDVTLTTEPNIQVLGNMPIRHQVVDEDGKLVTTFETTPRMSTYLLAWVTGELHQLSGVTKNGVEVNIWSTEVQPLESLTFARDIAVRTIDFFDEYFGTPYPLKKSDHVALPDFSSGAMENWGLITYREIALLADPATTSVNSKHYIATVIAHELSHQWFGNLVTMKWWNDLWLNESFATLMEYIAIDALEPSWNVWMDYATNESIMALRRDSIDGVQPVQVPVNHPDEINTLFDGAIVYAKGARLLRMLQAYIGHEAFQAGLKAYFAEYAYKNTEAADLWAALENASGKKIASLMSAWISQPGYPIVKAETNKGTLRLTQQQFFTGPHEPSDRIWPIPLHASDPHVPQLLAEQSVEVPFLPNESAVLRLNVGDSAHFITQYSQPLLKRLIDELSNGRLEPLDRLQLLHEHTLLARAGVLSSPELLPLLKAYGSEATESVWDIISLAIGELKKFVYDDEPGEVLLKRFAALLSRQQYDRLGWESRPDEPESDTKMRATIIGLQLYGEVPVAIEEARKHFETSSLESLNPELRALIIGAVVRHGNGHLSADQLVDTLLEAYKTTPSAELQQDIASGLTSTKHLDIINSLLTAIKNESIVRPQDASHWYVWLVRNKHGRAAAWSWLQRNWQWVEKTFSGDKSYDDFPRYTAGALLTREELEQYRAFFTPMLAEPALARVITIGISEIEARVELIERDGPAVRAMLAKL